jgi:hypothetical protein
MILPRLRDSMAFSNFAGRGAEEVGASRRRAYAVVVFLVRM